MARARVAPWLEAQSHETVALECGLFKGRGIACARPKCFSSRSRSTTLYPSTWPITCESGAPVRIRAHHQGAVCAHRQPTQRPSTVLFTWNNVYISYVPQSISTLSLNPVTQWTELDCIPARRWYEPYSFLGGSTHFAGSCQRRRVRRNVVASLRNILDMLTSSCLMHDARDGRKIYLFK